MPKIQLLIASAHVIVRTPLGTLLKGVRDFDVVGEVDLSHLVKTPVQLSPDVFLVELTEAGLRGLRLAASLMRAVPQAAVVILTSNENPSYVKSMQSRRPSEIVFILWSIEDKPDECIQLSLINQCCHDM